MENLTDTDRALASVAILLMLTFALPIAIAHGETLLAAWHARRQPVEKPAPAKDG
jgi:hypothetical protein